MEGDWIGTGTRTQLESGHVRELEVRVRATRLVSPDGVPYLRSENQVGERDVDGGVPRSYSRNYEVRPVPGAPSRVRLGAGVEGVWDEGLRVLTIRQDLSGGAKPALIIDSVTKFVDGGSVFEETWKWDETPWARAVIRYQRARGAVPE